MENRECKFQPFDICHRLFHFIMNILSSKAQETVTLGSPVSPESNASSREVGSCNHQKESHDKSSQEPMATVNSDQSVSSLKNDCQEERKELHLTEGNGSYVASSSHTEDKNGSNAIKEDTVSLPSATKRAPKKIVSIKDTVEDINSIMKERRKNKGTKRSKSFDFDDGYDGSTKPSRSILKVGSNIKDKSDLLNSLNRES